MPRCLYVFLDEAGNFDFSTHGTRYFMLGSIALERPFGFYNPLAELRLDLLEEEVDLECFHASEDRQSVRDKVFDVIQQHLNSMRIDATIIEKRKTGPSLRADGRFYPEMLGYHLRYVLGQFRLADYSKVVIVTDVLPMQRKRKAIARTVKQTLTRMLPANVHYCALHHESKSSLGLQVADYCTWAIYRKWDRQDERSFRLIARAVRSQFDIFRTGTILYY